MCCCAGRYWAPAACLPACLPAPPGTLMVLLLPPPPPPPPSSYIYIHTAASKSLPTPPPARDRPPKKKKKAVDKVLSSGSAGTFLKKTTFAQSFAPFPHVEILKQAAVSLEKSKEMSLTQRSSCGFRLKLTFARRKQKFQ